MASKNYPKNSYLESFNCFESLFHEAKENSVLLIDTTGIILDVNEAFLNAFGYRREDISGKNFAMLFTEEDLVKGLPQKELEKTVRTGRQVITIILFTKMARIPGFPGKVYISLTKTERNAF
jgi:PAS domain S-box-containing protein